MATRGLPCFKKWGFDLAIVDLVMPVKNGLKEAGALHTLTKPIDQKDLLAAIASLLRRSTGWQGVSD